VPQTGERSGAESTVDYYISKTAVAKRHSCQSPNSLGLFLVEFKTPVSQLRRETNGSF
jgi:hypothetical protein